MGQQAQTVTGTVDRSTPAWTTLDQLIGVVAMWAIRQSPHGWPEGLREALSEFRGSVAPVFNMGDMGDMAALNAAGIERVLREHLLSIGTVERWNCPKKEGPCDAADPDLDFIDLDALVRNLATSVYDENLNYRVGG